MAMSEGSKSLVTEEDLNKIELNNEKYCKLMMKEMTMPELPKKKKFTELGLESPDNS